MVEPSSQGIKYRWRRLEIHIRNPSRKQHLATVAQHLGVNLERRNLAPIYVLVERKWPANVILQWPSPWPLKLHFGISALVAP